jgi:hypothetical protein
MSGLSGNIELNEDCGVKDHLISADVLVVVLESTVPVLGVMSQSSIQKSTIIHSCGFSNFIKGEFHKSLSNKETFVQNR